MNEMEMTYEQIWSRADGSFVVLQDGMPRHIPNNEEYRGEWEAIKEYADANPNKVTPEPGPTEEEVREARIDEIKAELAELDRKLIRPLAEGEAERVAEIVAQKAALREELDSLE